MYADPMSCGPTEQTGAIVPRSTIAALVSRRNAALDLIMKARDQLHDALEQAAAAGGASWPGMGKEITDMMMSRNRRDEFAGECRRQIDASSWRNVVSAHGFERIMDRQAIAEFNGQLDRDPPVFDEETADATMRQLVIDADKLMRRGVANAFASLDRRFRSHDGFKIGTRVVIDHAFNDCGQWNHHARRDDTIRDVERVLMRLDGREVPERYAGIVGQIDEVRRSTYRPFACEVQNEHLRVKVYKNGNAHLWFLRDDLLRSINLLLAEHYGETLGEGCDAAEDDPLSRPTTAVAKNMGWFPTPAAVAEKVAGQASVDWSRPRPGETATILRTLEPSAGEGALIRALIESAANGGATLEIVAIELDPGRAAGLRASGLSRTNGHQVMHRDFLTVDPAETGLFDRIVMNPPFDRQNDIAHVAHAVKFLKPGGVLVAIMMSSVEYRDDRRTVAFRELIARMNGEIRDLPPGSFEESGTMVNTCTVKITAPWN